MTEEVVFHQDQLLERYRLLIHHVLHQYHLMSRDQDYQDYFQELYIELVRIARSFNGNQLSAKDQFRFTKYAGQGLGWYLGRLLQRQQRRKGQEASFCDGIAASSRSISTQPFRSLSDLYQLLTPEEWRLLDVVQDDNLSVPAKLAELNLSRSSYYRRCRQLRQKLADQGWTA